MFWTAEAPQKEPGSATPYVQHVPPPPPPPGRSGVGADDPEAAAGQRHRPYATLPEGWTTACDPSDGRAYYWNAATGQTSWTHPQFAAQRQQQQTTEDNRSPSSFWQPSSWFPTRNNDTGAPPSKPQQQPFAPEDPAFASRRPDNHECYCVLSLLLFAPVGLAACYHSVMVNRRWGQGRYGEAVHHARQAPRYACAGVSAGVAFWIFVLLVREESRVVDWRWPDWDFDWGGG